MKLKWFGHSCFLLTANNGNKLVFDPFNEKVGYPVPELRAHVVLTSHGHYDHANISTVKGFSYLYEKPEQYEACGFHIMGISSFHDNQGGAIRGGNVIFVVEADGRRICHCGDLGHILTPEICKQIGDIDVLLLPVGGVYTVDAESAFRVMQDIAPKVTVPMHYKTIDCQLGIEELNPFIALINKDSVMQAHSNVIDLKDIPAKPIVVMDYN